MFKRKKCNLEELDLTPHPDYEQVNTTVSEYFRKYSQGKIENLPQDTRPEVTDERSSDEMLNDDSKTNHMSCDDLDVLQEYEQHREEFEKAIQDIELTAKQKEIFLSATAVLDDPNSSADKRREAYQALEELRDKVTRARKI